MVDTAPCNMAHAVVTGETREYIIREEGTSEM
jgi:hypothetical protein